MKVFALVGKSGTGKSYKAMNVCRERHIKYLIDDGILISGQRKIIGSSAKREQTKVAAVKRAIFHHEDPRIEMRDKIKEINPDKLMIIGTSEKMVHQIARNLEIDPIDEIIMIEDVSTEAEIETAKFHRMHYGKHVIPLPTVEVKKDFSGYFLDTLKIFSRVFGRSDKIIEKSVVRPTFSQIGQYTISNKTLIQIVSQSIKLTEGVEKYTKIRINKKPEGLKVEVDLIIKFGYHINKTAEKVLFDIKKHLEMMTQMNVINIDIHVKSVHFAGFEDK
ncbi:Asp23/Gls24 family envelope stress response protein [Acidaminobacter sp. JC074]|uniref:Asp23/Gls24 family envelope stress response protein n=1 Tax=Acidaminobacter sp. JC074 TaxID=2530199 RepID=UPI001F0FABA0|nr:Asp23/Gls24 family envelope stress response protein [Acidaminobacter sp. JC074]MCH4891293.1 Asp23/Gls24 family envelope stress response protein [Acidaminobacter sp. JC074]